MQPMVVLDDAAVTQSSVAAGQPGDGPFDHRPMLTVFGQPAGVASAPPGGACPRVVSADPKGFAGAAAGAAAPQRAASAGRAESGPSAAADRRASPLGQVAVPAAWSTVKSSTVNPPAMILGTGAGLTRSVWPRSASS